MVSLLTDLVLDETQKLGASAYGTRAAPSAGRLVLIGPTCHEDGQPMEIAELPQGTPMYVGWRGPADFGTVLGALQAGNPERLALYGTTTAERHEVYRLKRVLRNELIRGEWYRVGPPLMAVIELLQKSFVPHDLGGSVYC